MNLRIVALCIALAPLVACTSGGGQSTETAATEGSTAAEPAAADGVPAGGTSAQDECIAALATHGAAIQALFDNTRSLHPQSETEPVTPVADLRMNASEEQLAAIYGTLHGNAALISGSAAVRGAERPIRVSDGVVNLTYAWNDTFTHTVAGQEIEVKTGSVINTDTQEEFDACFIELVESYGDAGQATVELTIAR
jgi:hypothetical protein